VKQSAGYWPNAEHVEEGQRDRLAINLFRRPSRRVRAGDAPLTAAIDENTWFCSLQSTKLSGETRFRA